MSEAASGYALPKQFWSTLTVALAAAVCWVLLVVFAIADITDDFPRGVTILTGTLAGVATFALAWLRQGQIARARHAELMAKLDKLEEIADRLGMIEEAFDIGRRYQELASDRNRPRLVN